MCDERRKVKGKRSRQKAKTIDNYKRRERQRHMHEKKTKTKTKAKDQGAKGKKSKAYFHAAMPTMNILHTCRRRRGRTILRCAFSATGT
jgi:hypothetical protein